MEACAFRDANDELVAAGATVWGISPDDAASHGRFRAKFHLTFPLLSDEDHATAEAYGAWVEKIEATAGPTWASSARRSWWRPDGRIAHAWPAVTAGGARRGRGADARRRPGRAAGDDEGRHACPDGSTSTSRTARTRPRPRARPPRGDADGRLPRASAPAAHDVAAGPLPGDRGPPRRRRVRPGSDRGRLDRRRLDRPPRLLHLGRPGRRGSGRRPPGPRRDPRGGAAPGRRASSATTRSSSSTSRTGRSPTSCRSASSWCARSGASGRTPS